MVCDVVLHEINTTAKAAPPPPTQSQFARSEKNRRATRKTHTPSSLGTGRRCGYAFLLENARRYSVSRPQRKSPRPPKRRGRGPTIASLFPRTVLLHARRAPAAVRMLRAIRV